MRIESIIALKLSSNLFSKGLGTLVETVEFAEIIPRDKILSD